MNQRAWARVCAAQLRQLSQQDRRWANKLKYTRTLEIKELSVPIEKIEDLKKFYRVIAGDERNTAVLKPSAAAASAK